MLVIRCNLHTSRRYYQWLIDHAVGPDGRWHNYRTEKRQRPGQSGATFSDHNSVFRPGVSDPAPTRSQQPLASVGERYDCIPAKTATLPADKLA